jgi:hemolysin activation/secretion protein
VSIGVGARRSVKISACSLLVLAAPAAAQILIPGDRPGDERPGLPPEEPTEAERRPILPPIPMPKQPEPGAIDAGIRIFVREIRITGNTVISTEELEKIAAPYENRALSYTDLQALSDALTLVYVERGYVTSGAVLPDQTVRDGVIEIRIVEGMLEDVEIETDGRIRPGYIRSRLQRGPSRPVNVLALENRLQLLQQDRRFQRVEAQLVPAETRGYSVLRVRIAEAPPYRLGGDFDNYRNPTIGSLGGEVRGAFDNAIGIGDAYFVRGAFTEGLRQAEARFEVPLTAYDTLLSLRYRFSRAKVVDANFAALDIESESETFGIELSQPLYRTLRTSLKGFVRGERRRAESVLAALGIGLPIAGAPEGVSKVSVLRFGLEGFHRSRSQVFSGRAILSWGIEAFDVTVNPGDVPDARFVAGLLQLQWARRLPWLDTELVARFDTQVSDDPLLPLEQFAIGGRYTVRGYRENTLVRDNGLVGGIEARIPVFQRVQPELLVEIVPFFDGGYSWNTRRPEVGEQTLLSVGIGTRVFFTRWGRFEFYWGHRIKDVPRVGEYDIQDDGIHFRLSMDWP